MYNPDKMGDLKGEDNIDRHGIEGLHNLPGIQITFILDGRFTMGISMRRQGSKGDGGSKGKCKEVKEVRKKQKGGTWTCLMDRPMSLIIMDQSDEAYGLKKKGDVSNIDDENVTEHLKKSKLDEETKTLSHLLATHLGLVGLLSLLSWNYQGLGNVWIVKTLKNVVRQ